MSQDVMDPNSLRRYLLGELTAEEQLGPIEERLLADDDFCEEFQLVKDDLIDEYVKTNSQRSSGNILSNIS